MKEEREDDPDCEDVEEVLPLERVVDPEGISVLRASDWRTLRALDLAMWDAWKDVWLGDAEPSEVDESQRTQVTNRLRAFRRGGTFLELRTDGELFSQVSEQLDPVWGLDRDAASRIFDAVESGVSGLEREALPPLRRVWEDFTTRFVLFGRRLASRGRGGAR